MAPRTALLVGGVIVVGVVGALVIHQATTKASKPAQTFTAGADAYVSAAKAATNYGRSSELSVDGSPVKRAYVRFVVAGVAGRPSRATLRVYATSPSRSGLGVSRVDEDGWAEQSLTWSNAPAIPGAPTATSSRFSPGWVAIDVTSLVAGDGVVSFAITEPDRTAVSLRSREAGGASAPQLVVESGATGVPTSAGASTATVPAAAPPASTSSDSAPPVIAAAGDIACNSAAAAPHAASRASRRP